MAHIGTPQEVSAQVGAALPGTRHIPMYTDQTHQDTIIKFLNVPNAYDLADIKHADHVGMFWTFNNGETWLVLNDKRLFVTPDYGDIDIEPDAGWPEDWPMMSPEELKIVLQEFPPHEEYQALLAAAETRHEDEQEHSNLQERTSCRTVRCHTSGNCYPHSTSTVYSPQMHCCDSPTKPCPRQTESLLGHAPDRKATLRPGRNMI